MVVFEKKIDGYNTSAKIEIENDVCDICSKDKITIVFPLIVDVGEYIYQNICQDCINNLFKKYKKDD